MTSKTKAFLAYFTGFIASIIYGLSCQYAVKNTETSSLVVMTWGFVFILPFSLGVITVYFASEKRQNSLAFRILMPWVSATVSLLLTIVTGLEGTICMIGSPHISFHVQHWWSIDRYIPES